MNHINRGRLEVTLGDGWMAYQRRLADADMLGIVVFGDRIGALVRRHADGVYCLANNGKMFVLNERKINAALRQ